MQDRPRSALGQLDASHRRHDERLAGLVAVAEQLCGGHGGPQDLEDLEDAVVWFARSVPRHFGDEDEVVFPALAAARPELAAALAEISAEHAGLLAAHQAVHDAVMSWDGREPPSGALSRTRRPGWSAGVNGGRGRPTKWSTRWPTSSSQKAAM